MNPSFTKRLRLQRVVFLILSVSVGLLRNGLGQSEAAPTPTPSSASSLSSDELKDKALAVTVAIEFNFADRAAGATGFVALYQGKKYIVTNLHVLRGEASTEAQMIWTDGPRDPGTATRQPLRSRLKTSYQEFQKYLKAAPLPKIQSSNGEMLRLGTTLLLSSSRDIALIPVETDIVPLEIESTPPKREQQVVVVGNPEAEHTIVMLDGKVKAIGPEKLELGIVSGELLPGMSGGPVLNAATGQAMGAISYKVEALKRAEGKIAVEGIQIGGSVKVERGSSPSQSEKAEYDINMTRVKLDYEIKVRNFAFRIDNISDLRPTTWAQFLLDCGTLHAMAERTQNAAVASQAPYSLFNGGNVVPVEIPPDFDNSIAMSHRSAMRNFNLSSVSEFTKQWNTYQQGLESLLNQDVKDPRYKISTSYIQNVVRTDLFAERQGVCTELRASAGKIPSRGEKN